MKNPEENQKFPRTQKKLFNSQTFFSPGKKSDG